MSMKTKQHCKNIRAEVWTAELAIIASNAEVTGKGYIRRILPVRAT